MEYFRKWWWLLPFLVLDLWLIAYWSGCHADNQDGKERRLECRRSPVRRMVSTPPQEPLMVGYPTHQTNLLQTQDSSVFMPTESGRVVSALYGSTRTRVRGGRAAAAFHEGIDIAPLERDRSGRALDQVFAIADGKFSYANRLSGGSSYGQYVVIEHDDPVGPVYSLYAHLASVEDGIDKATAVQQGRVVGQMGHSSTLGIPRVRSHLHFEVCLMLNRRFDAWCKKQKIGTQHGIHHGWNLIGIDPLALYPEALPRQKFSMLQHLKTLPAAFEIALRTEQPLDYFRMYDPLWQGKPHDPKVTVLSVCHGGVIIAGRPATAEEQERIGGNQHVILKTDEDALGRNGKALITRRNGAWQLTRYGDRWLDILLYH